MSKVAILLGTVMFLSAAAQAAVIFSDDFTGTNGDPLDSSKWTDTSPSGSGATIQDNRARLESTTQWARAQFTSTTAADFFATGAVATYQVDYHQAFNGSLYGFRTMDIAGSNRRLVLEWSNMNNHNGSSWGTEFYLFTCDMSYSYTNRVTLWEGFRGTSYSGDEGQTLTITVTPTGYTLDINADTTSGSKTGDHGLNAADFADGGFLTLTARKNAYDEYIWFDNAMIDYVPEPATMGLLAIGGLLALRRRGR